MSQLRGTAVVSGAGSGIGREIALALAARGHRLALLGRRRDPLEATLAAARAAGTAGVVYPADLRRADAVAGLDRRITAEVGEAEIVVAAAGVASVGAFAELTPDQIRATLETNLVGAAALFREHLPGLLARRRGTLVAILSAASRRTFAGWSAYTASKWGLLGLVESLRDELDGTGVAMVALTPGATATPLWDGLSGDWERERMIAAADVARALIWALDGSPTAAIAEIRIQPLGGNL